MDISKLLNLTFKKNLMIQLTFSLFFIMLLFSCESVNNGKDKKKEKTSESSKIELGTFSTNMDLKECHCDSLFKDSLNTYFKDDQLYTGRCFANYPSSEKKYMEMSFLKGKIHGFFTVYDKSGEILSKDRYHNGDLLKSKNEGKETTIYCSCDSLKEEKLTFGNKSIKKYKDIPFTGVCYDYYPESKKKYMEINYKKGFPHGKLIVYDKSGKVITVENYEKGEEIN